MKSIWTSLKKPITVLAPMEDVTDSAFRRIVASCARPDIFFTEFTSVDGLFSRGRDEVIHRFDYTSEEKPIIAQVWGNNPDLFYNAARVISGLGFDGMDINIGCPERNVTSRGAGACLIDNQQLVSEIIAAARKGLAEKIPLSVKTRLGYKKINPDWLPFLLERNLDAITIHGRTAAELSKVPAQWNEIGHAVTIRNKMKKNTIIIGNGDVTDYKDAVRKCTEYGTDGVMIGRGIFHNLWAFDRHGISHMDDRKKLFSVMREHMRLFSETTKNFAVLKKFFKIYVHGFPEASHMREELMQSTNRHEAETILGSYEKNFT